MRSLEACCRPVPRLAATCPGSVSPHCPSVPHPLQGVPPATPPTHNPFTRLLRSAPGEAEGQGPRSPRPPDPDLTKCSRPFLCFLELATTPLLQSKRCQQMSIPSSLLETTEVISGHWRGSPLRQGCDTPVGSTAGSHPRGRMSQRLVFGDGKGQCHLLSQSVLVSSPITGFLGQLSRRNLVAFDLQTPKTCLRIPISREARGLRKSM